MIEGKYMPRVNNELKNKRKSIQRKEIKKQNNYEFCLPS